MLPLEIQIRTRDMHLQAEFGIAAHWRYKEDVRSCSSSVPEMVEWVRRVVTYQRETLHIDHPSSLGPDTSPSNIHTIRSHSDVCPFSYSKQCDHSGPVLVVLLENEKVPPILLRNRFLCSTAEGLGATDLRAPWFRGPQVSGRVSLQYCRGDSSVAE